MVKALQKWRENIDPNYFFVHGRNVQGKLESSPMKYTSLGVAHTLLH